MDLVKLVASLEWHEGLEERTQKLQLALYTYSSTSAHLTNHGSEIFKNRRIFKKTKLELVK